MICPTQVVADQPEATGVESMDLPRIEPDRTMDVSGLTCPLVGMKPATVLRKMEQGRILEVTSEDPHIMKVMPELVKRTGDELLGYIEDQGRYRCFLKKV